MDSMLQHLLETNIQQQAVTQELAQSLHTATRELLELKRKPCSTTSVPDPCQEVACILTKLTSEDDVEAFLLTYERVARYKEWEEKCWVDILTPFMSGEAQRTYYTLLPEQASHYPILKAEILGHCDLPPFSAAAEFHSWSYQPVATLPAQMGSLL